MGDRLLGITGAPVHMKRSAAIAALLTCVALTTAGVLWVGVSVLYSEPDVVRWTEPYAQSLPQYPGSRVTRLDDGGQIAYTRYFETGDPPSRVHEFYKDVLLKKGWTLSETITATNETVFAWRHTSPRYYDLTVSAFSEANGKTRAYVYFRSVPWSPPTWGAP
jgi:hypothetical protein